MESKVNSLLRNPVLLLGILFCIIASLIFGYLYRLNSKLIENNTIQSARQYSEAITAFRTLYTSEVVSKALDNGLIASHDYQQLHNAIPLPATLSMLLGEKMGVAGYEVKTKLYSAYPFPWRVKTGGLSDKFARDAWQFLQLNPDKPFVTIAKIAGEPSVRYAVADVMRPACVHCHNSHPQTPKNDWRVGDVRGVLEVTLPLKAGLLGAQQISLKVMLLVVAMLLLTVTVLYFMTRQLMARHQQALQLNRDLSIEVDERQRAEQEAVQANRTKSLFLANISHEIRTPMNAILGYTQIIQRDKNLNEQQRDALRVIAHSGEHLLGLINDVLDISKIESGILELYESTFDLEAMLLGIGEMFKLKTLQKGLHWKLYLDVPHHHLMVQGDEGKLRQILINLIGNAVKFTDAGYVQFKVAMLSQHEFSFSISDSGMGIEPDELAQLFTPFSQGSAGLRKGGTGLGLAITQKYLHLMDSELVITSNPDHGTEIQFNLMLPVVAKNPVDSEDERPVTGLADGRQLRILVVDDNEINRDVLAKMLTNIGVQVKRASNGEKALKLMAKQKFDIIFTDIDMPMMDGYQLMTNTAYCGKNHDTPVVAITASTLEQNVAYFHQRGFADYLGKPFLLKNLYRCIKAVADVEFEYEDVAPPIAINNVADADIKLPPSPWPEKIKAAAELSLVSDIEQLLQQLLQQDEQNQPFIALVKRFLAHYDMDGLLEYLEQRHG